MKWIKKNGSENVRPAGLVRPEVSDRFRYVPEVYTPARLKRIMEAANSGDTQALCICGREILERSWDIMGAFEQRASALLGAGYDILPGGDSPLDKECAEAFEKALRKAGDGNTLGTFHDLLSHLLTGVILPFAAAEIVWSEGGNIAGFTPVGSHHFTMRDSFTPRLVTEDHPDGLPEEEMENHFVIHTQRKNGDMARGGLIRALAYLHCFQNWPIKDLFSFIERFGMPFVIAKVDQNTWENERNVLHSLIRSFGPNGGGVFTKSTELQLLNASNTGSDNVYFRALEFTHNAIYTLLVGQLASSGDSSGMSNGSAQTAVRQDILEADARSMESTIRSQIASVWTSFHYPEAAVPLIQFKVDAAEDLNSLAQMVATLSQAGYKADEQELSGRFGLKLRYEAPAVPSAPLALSDKLAAAELGEAGSDRSDLSDALEEWLGPMVKELEELSSNENMSEREFAERLKQCAEGRKFGSSEKFEKYLESEIYKGFTHGVIQ